VERNFYQEALVVCYLHCKEVENPIRGSKPPRGRQPNRGQKPPSCLRLTVQWLILMPLCTTQKPVVKYILAPFTFRVYTYPCQYLLLTNTFCRLHWGQ